MSLPFNMKTKKVLFDFQSMLQLSNKDQGPNDVDVTATTNGHCMLFNNEQNRYQIWWLYLIYLADYFRISFLLPVRDIYFIYSNDFSIRLCTYINILLYFF